MKRKHKLWKEFLYNDFGDRQLKPLFRRDEKYDWYGGSLNSGEREAFLQGKLRNIWRERIGKRQVCQESRVEKSVRIKNPREENINMCAVPETF